MTARDYQIKWAAEDLVDDLCHAICSQPNLPPGNLVDVVLSAVITPPIWMEMQVQISGRKQLH